MSVLRVGSRVRLHGSLHEVVSFDDQQVLGLCGPDLTVTRWTVARLMAQPGVEVLNDEPSDPQLTPSTPTDAFLIDVIPEQELRRVKELAGHLREVITGLKEEDVDRTGAERPDPRYDPDETKLTERVHAKAEELRVHPGTLWEKLGPFRSSGGSLLGLVDRRLVRARRAWEKLDERVRVAMVAEIKELEFGSNVSKNTIRLRVQRRLDREHGPGVVSAPPKSTFNRRLDELGRGKGLFGRAKTRRGNSRRPQTPYIEVSFDRAGQLLIVDITPLDVHAIDPLTLKWVNVDLLMALDVCTRSIVSVRLVPAGSKDIDAGMLVRDAMLPKFAPPAWGEEARWRYWGTPDALITELRAMAKPGSDLAGIPCMRYEAITGDNAWIFESLGLREGLKKHRIDLIPARLIQPTDKAMLERTFRTAAVALLEHLRGYKGPDVWSRGEHIEDQAVYFIPELEAILWEWVARVWQNRPHESLRIDPALNRRLTPNEAFDLSLRKWGFLHVPASDVAYYDFLSVVWVKRIHHDGIRLNNQRYDGEILDPYRNRRSPYGGLHAGEWPARINKIDLSRAYLMDPKDGSWGELRSKYAAKTGRHFTDLEYAFAKGLAWQDGAGRITEAALEARLNEIVVRAEELIDESGDFAKVARRAAMQHAQRAHDQAKSSPSRPAAPADRAVQSEPGTDEPPWQGPADWRPPEVS